MDVTTLAAWGEFLGGIAVVVSLIYQDLSGRVQGFVDGLLREGASAD